MEIIKVGKVNKYLYCLSLVLLFSKNAFSFSCDVPFEKCICGEMDYAGKIQYVVNCTDLKFEKATMLQHLPKKTQVLIFVGNNLSKLPRNLLGTASNITQLKVIDMSNNKIEEILGQTFHHVPNVERLVLNHNKISIDSDESHPRVFSNLYSLKELHLTNAFADNTLDDLAKELHDIFSLSELTKLQKLHLEQNEIGKFNDPKIFCELTSLMDLHLGDNKLQHINFKFDCLPHLRFIDLQRNKISSFSADELMAFDHAVANTPGNFTIDISDNSLICDDIEQLYSWLTNTKVQVRHENKLKCKRNCSKESGEMLFISEHQKLLSANPVATSVGYSSNTVSFLSLALVIALGLLVYTNRRLLKEKINPVVQNLSRKVHYTTIGKNEVQEMDV